MNKSWNKNKNTRKIIIIILCETNYKKIKSLFLQNSLFKLLKIQFFFKYINVFI